MTLKTLKFGIPFFIIFFNYLNLFAETTIDETRISAVQPVLSCASEVHFSETVQNYSRTQVLKITNTGTDILSITDIIIDNDVFSVDITEFLIYSSFSSNLTITYTPTDVQSDEATLTFISNGGNVTVSLFGEAVAPLDYSFSQESFDFNFFSGEIETQNNLTISNNSEVDINFYLEVEGSGNWLSITEDSINVTSGTTSDLPFIIDSYYLSEGTYQSRLILEHQYINTIIDTIYFNLHVTDAPNISTPDSILFDTTLITKPTTQDIIITNRGNETLNINSLSFNGNNFSINQNAPLSINSHGQLICTITLEDEVAGLYKDSLILESNDPQHPIQYVYLEGFVEETPIFETTPNAPISITIDVGDATTQSLTISNNGGSNLEWYGFIQSENLQNNTTNFTQNNALSFDLLGSLDLNGIHIGYRSQYGHTTLFENLSSRGATMSSLSFEFDDLSQFNVLIIDFVSSHLWTENQYELIKEWIHNGGALLLEGGYTSSIEAYNHFIPEESGITLIEDEDHTGTSYIKVVEHAITKNINHFYNYQSLDFYIETEAPAETLLTFSNSKYDNETFSAVSYYGKGAILLNSFKLTNSNNSQQDKFAFVRQSIDWLVLNSGSFRLDINSSIIEAGNSEELTFTINASNITGGLYHGNINFISNDVYTPSVQIPLTIDVVGIPNIVMADSLVMDSIIITEQTSKQISIANHGTDTLHINSLTFVNGYFTIDNNEAFSLAVGEEVSREITITKDIAGMYTDSLVIESNDPEELIKNVYLEAVIEDPPIISVTPTEYEITIEAGTSTTKTFTITNSGQAPLRWTSDIIYDSLSSESSFRKSIDDDNPINYRNRSLNFNGSEKRRELKDLTGIKILCYSTRYGALTDTLIARGAEIDYLSWNQTELSNIDSYDLLIAEDLETSGYINWGNERIHDWVLSGGALLLNAMENDYSDRQIGFMLPPNSGISMQRYNINLPNEPEINDHEITEGIDDFYIPYNFRDRLVTYNQGFSLVDFKKFNYKWGSVSAASKVANGAVLVNVTYKIPSFNLQYTLQSIDWLLSNTSDISLTPDSGSVITGTSETVDLNIDVTHWIEGKHHFTIRFESNDFNTPIVDIPFVLNVTGSPEIEAENTVVIDTTYTNTSKSYQLEIANTGTSVLEISSFSINLPEFTIDDSEAVSIPINESIIRTITFSPSETGDIEGVLTINSNAPNNESMGIILKSTSIAPPIIEFDVSELNFNLNSGDSATQSLTIKNTGEHVLKWQANAVNHKYDSIPFEELNVLYDLSYYRDLFIDELAAQGVNLVKLSDGISHLEDFDLLISDGNEYPSIWTQYEYEMIQNWIRNGGKLFVSAKSHQSSGHINSLIPNEAGISAYDYFNKFFIAKNYTHDITHNIDELYIHDTYSYLELEGNAHSILDFTYKTELDGKSLMAASQVGKGVVVALGDELFNYDHFTPILLNIFNWLVSTEGNHVDLDNYSGEIAPGSSSDINVKLLSEGLNGGSNSFDIQINSNDSINSFVEIPINVNVTEVANIHTEAIIDFDTVDIGQTEEVNWVIENKGALELTIDDITVSSMFTLAIETPFSIAPYSDTTIIISGTFNNLGDIEEAITISSNDLDETSVSVSVLANVVNPPSISISPGSLSATLVAGNSVNQTLTIVNSGGRSLKWNPLSYVNNHEAKVISLTGIKILYDSDYYNGSNIDFFQKLVERGATLERLEHPITDFSQYDLFICRNSYDFWSTDEYNLFHEWIKGGGALLIESDENTQNNKSHFNNLIPTEAGIIKSNLYSHSSEILVNKHQVSLGIDEIYPTNSSWYNKLHVSEEANVIIYSNEIANVISAVSKVENGHIAVNGTDLLAYDELDNYSYGHQLINWLLKTDPIKLENTNGQIAANSSGVVNVTLDASYLPEGNYDLTLSVNSDDELTPNYEIPVSLTVIYDSDGENEAPKSNEFEDMYVCHEDELIINLNETFSDPDEDVLNYSFALSEELNGLDIGIVDGTMKIQNRSFAENLEINIEVTAADIYNLTTTQSLPLKLGFASISQDGLTLTATEGEGYQWYKNSEIINGEISQTYIVTETADYHVEVNSGFGCINTSPKISITPITSLSSESNSQLFKIFPNPFSDSFNVSIKSTIKQNSKLRLIDVHGKEIMTLNSIPEKVNVGSIPQGLYLVQLIYKNQIIAAKQIMKY